MRARPRFPPRGTAWRGFPFGGPDAQGIVGDSAAIWDLRDRLGAAAQSREHVLLLGAFGAGKALAARSIHQLSARRDGAFVARNAATLPESLLDAELFGSARNYPNPGSPERAGLVGAADGGTLFLDEIGELPEAHQAHVLRVLDRGGELWDAMTRAVVESEIAAARVVVVDALHEGAASFCAHHGFVRVPGNEHRLVQKVK